MRKIYGLILITLPIYLLFSCDTENDVYIEPQLIVSEDSLVFNEIDTKTLYVSTKPAVECEFQVIAYPDWVNVYPTSGKINNSIEPIAITSNYNSDIPGIYTGNLVIMSTTGIDTVFLQGFVGENISYSVQDSVHFSVFNESLNFSIVNYGNVGIYYELTISNDLVSIGTSISDSIQRGSYSSIQVNLNRESMETGTYESMIFVDINNKVDTVHISIENFKEQKLKIDSDVIDAEFSKEKGYLAYVSSTDNKLNIYDISTNSYENIDLLYVPTCLSLSLDGNYAVVGHDGHLTYVDMVNKTIINDFDVSCYAGDIVLGNNNWAYVFPKQDQWEDIRCINVNLLNNNEVLHEGNSIYAGTKAKLHPSGKYIYGADNGLSPSDMEKYDIQNDIAVYLYDSPYHGDYSVSGDLWFSEDGIRVFTKGKTVFKTSEIQEQDMLYNGKIDLEIESSSSYSYAKIQWLDHSANKDNLYVLSTGDEWGDYNKPFLYVYNASNLVFKNKFELEEYLVLDNQGGGAFYDAEPYFVFSNSDGNQLFVITKAVESGLVNEWAIQKFTIE